MKITAIKNSEQLKIDIDKMEAFYESVRHKRIINKKKFDEASEALKLIEEIEKDSSGSKPIKLQIEYDYYHAMIIWEVESLFVDNKMDKLRKVMNTADGVEIVMIDNDNIEITFNYMNVFSLPEDII